MRDINRIDKFCAELAEQWKKYPDFRFGQMMMNIFGSMREDPFFPEDNVMMEYIKNYMDGLIK